MFTPEYNSSVHISNNMYILQRIDNDDIRLSPITSGNFCFYPIMICNKYKMDYLYIVEFLRIGSTCSNEYDDEAFYDDIADRVSTFTKC